MRRDVKDAIILAMLGMVFITIAIVGVVNVFADSITDSIGVVGGFLSPIISKFDPSGKTLLLIISLLSAAAFRGVQIVLQILPTRWSWVNNKLTVSIVSKLISLLFGKTTLLYNAQPSDGKAKVELKKEAAKHLARHGGILSAYEDAMKELS